MGDHTDYYLDPALEKMFHKDLSRLDLHDHDNSSNDIIGAHLPEWLIGVIIVIIMLLVAFFVMVITSLIRKRKKNQSHLPADGISSAVVCDDLESGKIGQCDDSNSKTTILSCSLQGESGDNSCPPEKDFTSTSHKALQEVSSQAGCSCQNPLFVDDEDHDPGESRHNLEGGTGPKEEETLTETESASKSESSGNKGSPHKHKASKAISATSTPNSPISSSMFCGNIKKVESEMNLHETKPDLTRSPTSCQLPVDVFNDSSNEYCHSISSCSDDGDEGVKDRDSIKNCTSFNPSGLKSQETTLKQQVTDCNGIEGALDPLDILGAICNRSDDDDIEKDTGIMSTVRRDKHGHVHKSSSSSSEEKCWSTCNGSSPQELVSRQLTPSNSLKSNEIVSVGPDTTDSIHPADIEQVTNTITSTSRTKGDTRDSLSTNL